MGSYDERGQRIGRLHGQGGVRMVSVERKRV
jgi:hypothetical protein